MTVNIARPVLPKLVETTTPNQSSRHGAQVKKVVLHVTEGGYAGAVQWMRNPKSEVSSHFCLREDGLEATQLVKYASKAWTEVNANAFSVSIEMAGYADQQSDAQLAVAARITAFLLHHFHLPVTYAPSFDAPGFCRHGDLGAAGGGHYGCPMTQPHFLSRFVPLVHRETVRGGFLPRWGS